MALGGDSKRMPSSASRQLVGRDPELKALRRSLANTLSGRGSLTIIYGEAGAGKTALADSICRDAMIDGALVLVGRCYDVSFTPLYGAWVDLFADYEQDEELPPPFARRGILDTIANQPTLLDEVRGFLARLSAVRPVVLLFDDLQWADLSSCELLRHVCRHTSTHQLMVLATVSEDALTRGQPLHRLLPAVERECAAERVTLSRLTADELRTVVTASYQLRNADLLRLVAYVNDMTGGNALLATELLKALEEQKILRRYGPTWILEDLRHIGVPLRLRQIVDNRLLRLPEESQDLLAAAAVIGPEVPFSLWTTVVGGDEDRLLLVLEEAAEARLVEPTREGISFRFAHALIHEALYERIFPIRRRLIHRRVGEALADLGVPNPDAVARHFHSADDNRSAEWLVRAGQRAEEAGSLLTAVERYEAALRPMEQAGAAPSERARMLLRIAILRRMDDSWRAVTYIDMAKRLADGGEDAALPARVLVGRGLVRCYAGTIEHGIQDLIEGIAATEAETQQEVDQRPRGPGVDMLLNRGSLVVWLAFAGRSDEARSLAGGALDVPSSPQEDQTGTGIVAGTSWGMGFVHAMQGRVEEAARAYTTARDAFQRLDQHRLSFIAIRDELVHVVLAYRADDMGERERLAVALRDMAERGTAARAFVDAIDNVRYPLLHLMALEGHWDEVHHVVDAMGEYGIPVLRHLVSSVLGPVARAQGDLDRAWQLVRDTWPAGPSTKPGSVECYHTLPQQRLAADLALDEGDLVGALAWLEAHDRWLAWGGFVQGRAEGQCLWARYERASGKLERAARHAERALSFASEPRQPLALLNAYRLLGELDGEAGRHESAKEHFAAALALADATSAPYGRAVTLLASAEHALAAGDVAGVAEVLAEARALCVPLRAAPALARADELADALAAQQPVVISYPAGLTEREAEVLGLLAQGLSDKEIAALLHLSPRTVGRHVEKAYRKVGAHRRAEAAVFAIRHGLVKDPAT